MKRQRKEKLELKKLSGLFTSNKLKVDQTNNERNNNALQDDKVTRGPVTLVRVSKDLDQSKHSIGEVVKPMNKQSRKKKVVDSISADAQMALERGGGKACVA